MAAEKKPPAVCFLISVCKRKGKKEKKRGGGRWRARRGAWPVPTRLCTQSEGRKQVGKGGGEGRGG